MPRAKRRTGEAETAIAFKNTSKPTGILDLDNPKTNPARSATSVGLRIFFLKVSKKV